MHDGQRQESSPAPGPVTVLLQAAAAGDRQAFERLLDLVYVELRALAQARMNHERKGHTLQPTALVNEAYIRLLGREDIRWNDRAHFFRAAADAMRRILIDHARARNAGRRGGGKAALHIANLADAAFVEDSHGFLALDDAIVRLEGVDAQAAAVVRLKFYAGLGDESDDCVASALGISERTVRRDWTFARSWLRDALQRDLQ